MLPFFTCRSEVLLDFCIPVQSFQFHCFLGNMIWFLVDVGLSSTVVFLHLQYGATRVECQPDGTLAYPGAHIQGENGIVFFFCCSSVQGTCFEDKKFFCKIDSSPTALHSCKVVYLQLMLSLPSVVCICHL
jgi:hypothetical protein